MWGLAWSPAALLAARVVEGVGAAIMTATALSIISTTFPDGSERNKALGIWGAIVAQAAVLRVGFRPVALTGMALMGAGSLLLTQVSVGGSYFGDIFFGLLVFGPGVGFAFVTATVAALAGVAEEEAGLASGLSNTALQVGGALGVAIVTTVAVSRSDDYLAANQDANPLVVLNEGFQSAFLAVAVLAAIGVALALLLPGRPRKAPQERLEPIPATRAAD
jgi:MFS family permease